MAKRSQINPRDAENVTKLARRKLLGISKRVRLWWFYVFAPAVLEEAIRRAPIDKGPLRESGFVTINGLQIVGEGRRDGVDVRQGGLGRSGAGLARSVIGFGGQLGDQLTYAKLQHETTWFRHERGEAKFLENAVNVTAALALPGLREALEAGLRE